MNRKLNAVALSNKALTEENKRLWAENDMVRRGADERDQMYKAMITQLILEYGLDDEASGHGTCVVLPKTDVASMMREYDIEAQRGDDGSMMLRAVIRRDNEENEEDGNEVDQADVEGNTAEPEHVCGAGEQLGMEAREEGLDGCGPLDAESAGNPPAETV